MDFLKDSYAYGTSPLTPSSLSQPLKGYFFGTPISKSLSPVLVPIIFRHVPSSWALVPVDTTSTTDFISARDTPDFLGSSITMPNKITYKPLLDELTDSARVIGAVNTTFVRVDPSTGKRRHIGTNTDCVGIRDTLTQKVPCITETARNKPALVIGAGGAARSAIYALWTWMKPSDIYISNRLESEVQEIIDSFGASIPGIKLRYIGSVDAAAGLETPYIICGTIPDYPATQPGEIECLKIYNHFLGRKEKGVLLDMCYIPNFLTKLYVAGRQQGWTVISGMDVVVRVIAAQAVLWIEREPSETAIKEMLDIVYEQARIGDESAAKL